jgi:hypothetical protein
MSLVIHNKSLEEFDAKLLAIVQDYIGSFGDNSPFELWLRSELGHYFEYVRAACTNRSDTLTNKWSRIPRTPTITNLSLTWMPVESQPPSLHDITLMGWPRDLRTLMLKGIKLTPNDICELVRTIPTLYKLTIDDLDIKDESHEEGEIVFPLDSQFTILKLSRGSHSPAMRTLLRRILKSDTNLNKIQFIGDVNDYVSCIIDDSLHETEFITLLVKGYEPTAFCDIDASEPYTLMGERHTGNGRISKNISKILAVGRTTQMGLCHELFCGINHSVGFQSVKFLHIAICKDYRGDDDIDIDTYETMARAGASLTQLSVGYREYNSDARNLSFLSSLMKGFVCNLPNIKSLTVDGEVDGEADCDLESDDVREGTVYTSVFKCLSGCRTITEINLDHELEGKADRSVIKRILKRNNKKRKRQI